MVIAKNPGVGRGQGGGRPRGRVRVAELVQLRLSPRVVELLRTAAESKGLFAWEVVEQSLLGALEAPGPGVPPAPQVGAPGAPLPSAAQEIAQECAAFLEAQGDRPAALNALRRAWKQALALARHDLQATPQGALKHEGLEASE